MTVGDFVKVYSHICTHTHERKNEANEVMNVSLLKGVLNCTLMNE